MNKRIQKRDNMNEDECESQSEFEKIILGHTLKTYFESHTQADIQTDSFNFFINHRLKDIVESEGPIEVNLDDDRKFVFCFSNVYFQKPYILNHSERQLCDVTPAECRLRDLTYSGSVICDVSSCILEKNMKTKEYIQTELKCEKRKVLCKIPVMLNSTSCVLNGKSEKDRVELGESINERGGGYFICKGKERVLVSSERSNHNEIYVLKAKDTSKYEILAEIRSMSEQTKHSLLLTMKIMHKKTYIGLPFLSNDVMLSHIIMAFGLGVDEVRRYILKYDSIYKEYGENIILEMIRVRTQENAINILAENSSSLISNKRKYILQILNNELLPHFGLVSNKYKKVLFLLIMLRKIILVETKQRVFDDRDNFSNKRIEVSGNLIGDLFSTLFKRFLKTISMQLEKRPDIQIILNKTNILSVSLYHSFATGNWGIQRSYIRQGVSQIMSRFTNASYLSHIRRVMVPVGKEGKGKSIKIRLIHPSQFGFLCPSESPEGQQCGSVKNLTQFVRVSRGFKTVLIKDILDNFLDTKVKRTFETLFKEREAETYIFIFINGSLYAYINKEDVEYVCSYLKNLRNKKILMYDVSISFRDIDGEIHIFSDEGRLLRPVFVTEKIFSLKQIASMSFDELCEEGIIQYFDSYEIQNQIIAINYQDFKENPNLYTALEIHPCMITSLSTQLLPFPDHTQAPRVTYHCAMGKQAISYPFSNLDYRSDTTMYMLSYPEKPVIQSHSSKYNACDDMSFGCNLIVAIAMYSGFNQEDSVIMNKSAIDRGLLRCFSYKTICVEEKRKSTICSEKIQFIEKELRNQSYNYSKIDQNTGIVRVGQYVGSLDVIVSKLQKNIQKNKNNASDTIWKDSSVTIKPGEEGVVDKVYITTNSDSSKIVKIKIRLEKIPEIGDKVASRCSQKGTIALILPEESMPFSQSGMIPDLIISPLAFISRMTLNQILESYISKSSLKSLKEYFSTPFSEVFSKNILEKILKEDLHLDPTLSEYGNEIFYNGLTGEKMETKVFMGNVFYHRLKHLVSNKLHSRSTGNINVLTRQPLEGRSRDGGLRCGEMEKDTIVSHGCSRLLRERLFNVSDCYYVYVCGRCGFMCPHTKLECNSCKSKNKNKLIPLPFACKLLFHQLQALGLKINLFPNSNNSITS